MRCTTTVLFLACVLFFLLGSTGFTRVIVEGRSLTSNEKSSEFEAVVFQLDDLTYKFLLANNISKEDQAFYKKRLNHGVKFAQSIELTKKSCEIVFKSDSTEDEKLQGITFAIKTFRFKTFKITTHE